MKHLAKMSDAEFAEYGLKILHALPFADNDAGLPQTAEFIREQARRLTAAAEREKHLKDSIRSLESGVEMFADERDAARADLEICMEALERLKQPTVGPAILGHICEAGRNEIEYRREIAEAAQKMTASWKEADAAVNTNPIAAAATKEKP